MAYLKKMTLTERIGALACLTLIAAAIIVAAISRRPRQAISVERTMEITHALDSAIEASNRYDDTLSVIKKEKFSRRGKSDKKPRKQATPPPQRNHFSEDERVN